MRRENAEITKQGIGIKSIVKDWSKMRDWELAMLVDKGYEEAIEEQKRRMGGQDYGQRNKRIPGYRVR